MNNLYKVAGVSTLNGVTKVRYANDIVRVKILAKHGHTNIELYELPQPMTKGEICTFLKTHEMFATPEFASAIIQADEKYNGKSVKVTKPNLDALKAKAEAVKQAESTAELVQS